MDKPLQDPVDTACKAAGRPKAADVEARLQELLQTAGALFLKNGYTKTSLESIARAAHVAVRTIYVKFGGKAGLLHAVLAAKRDRFFRSQPMQTDTRPLKVIVDEFARNMYELLTSQEAVDMQRIVMAEAPTNPELAEAFWNGGPRQTREMLRQFFARPDIRAQLREDLELDLLPGHLMTCIAGDQLCRFVFPPEKLPPEQALRELERRMDLFYRAILDKP
ncbi:MULTISPECIES: TetR/AcrR family transcriptional regulator [unclassified Massilia]|uniref:TetR/AcrR family transcriptional regulator n=1 Tax=unclassified Massilia TaxID=2609279 RepID=UPI00068D8442|nr:MULTISPECIES: TetR/AcrR family transcriptional regulator [unclassified Massilia]ALK99794.2 TetR family transcriptional regulator [Massilia sp. WG5]